VFYFISDSKLRNQRYSYEGRMVAGTNLLLIHVPALNSDHKLRVIALPPELAIVEGRLFGPRGEPLKEPVEIELTAEGRVLSQFTVTEGNYFRCAVLPQRTINAELAATCRDIGARRGGLSLSPGKVVTADLILSNAVSISGQVVALDPERTPLGGVVVEASREMRPPATCPPVTTLSNSKGEFQFVNLPQGRYRVRCLTPNGAVEGTESELEVEPGRSVPFLQIPCPQFKKGHWWRYNSFDGLAHNSVSCATLLSDGRLAFGTEGGVSIFDGARFETV